MSQYGYWQRKNALDDYEVFRADMERRARAKADAEKFCSANSTSFSFVFSALAHYPAKNLVLLTDEREEVFYVAFYNDVFAVCKVALITADKDKAVLEFYSIAKGKALL